MAAIQETQQIQQDTIEWQTDIRGKSCEFTVPVFSGVRAGNSDFTPTVINFNGIGEGRYSASVAPLEFGGEIVSPVLPFQEKSLKLTPITIEKVANEVPPLLIEFAQRLSGERDKKLSVVARSQGGLLL